MGEPISAEELERWNALRYESTGVSWAVAARLLDALAAGEALAEALDNALAINRYFAEMRRPDARMIVERGDAALAAWRACVHG
jgi:hypothetical protein